MACYLVAGISSVSTVVCRWMEGHVEGREGVREGRGRRKWIREGCVSEGGGEGGRELGRGKWTREGCVSEGGRGEGGS